MYEQNKVKGKGKALQVLFYDLFNHLFIPSRCRYKRIALYIFTQIHDVITV